LIQWETLPTIPAFQTVHLLRGVFTHGTARLALSSGLPLENFAGKTGTTNDAKDAWFVGFSPGILTLVWVGYDTKEALGLTGAAAALPLWIDYMRSARPFLSVEDFAVPPGLKAVTYDRATQREADEGATDPQVEYLP